MKKYFYLAAVSAMMLTACTSEKDVLETKTGPAQQEITQKAVGFDVYVPEATGGTRAGFNEGTMNTTRLQFPTVGFGIFAYYSDQSVAADNSYPTSGYVPNFMYNEHVTWNDTNKGWAYSPLKYWPNETIKDSQANPGSAIMDGTNDLLDQLTFFAYAPWVTAGSGSEGITAITASANGQLTTTDATPRTLGATDALVEYTQSGLVKNGVDLLWGVAPAGGLHYTAVNGNQSGANEGFPYVNLVKPDVNTSLKFYFQHALARFGFTVAAAIDQVPQGGELATETKVTVESVELSGYFGTKGILNLNNKVSNVANWVDINGTPLAPASDIGAAPLVERTVTINGTNLNPNIKDSGSDAVQTVTVTTAKQDLFDARYSKVDKPTSYSTSKAYYTSAGVEKPATMANTGYFLTNAAGDYIKVGGATINSPALGSPIPTYYTITPGDAVTTWTSGVLYQKVGDNYVKVADPSGVTVFTGNDYFQFTATDAGITAANFTYPDGDYYLPERSYLMVIPTNNVPNISTNFGTDLAKEPLKTVWVTITYYVTTADAKLNAGFSRVKNVIKKKVVLPSLENGKSYNLNLLLGLTSVKVEAEVGDWKEEYIQTDLPQNTPGD